MTMMTKMTSSLTGLGLLTLLLPLAAQEANKKATESGDRAAQELGQSLKPLSGVFAAQQAKKQDSLRHLIRQLDSGPSTRGSSAYGAYTSLRSLGSLMIPSLLAELDGLGPFGLMNASKLLASFPDESLGGLVARYLEDPSPARQEMAAGLLSNLAPETRRKLYPLALASKRDKVRLDGLRVMIGLGSSSDAVMAEIQRIYKEGRTSTRTSLIYLLRERDYTNTAQGRQLLSAAMKDPDRRLRETGFDVYVRLAQDEAEPAALAMVAKMDASDRETFAHRVLDNNRKWPGVLMRAIERENIRQQIPNFLNRNGIRLSASQIESLLLSNDLNLVRLGLDRLAVRKDLVPEMKPLLDLMDHPDAYVRQQSRSLLSNYGPLLILEGGRLRDLRQESRHFGGPIAVLEKAHTGHWCKEMLALWNEIEQAERENPGLNVTGDKLNLARLMARKLTAADWPLVEDFLRQAYQDPRGPTDKRTTYYTRLKAVNVLLQAGYLDRNLQPKALLLTSVTTEKIAMLIFDQVSESLVEGEARPEIEAALFQVIADARNNKRDASQVQKRYAYPRGELLDSAFQVLAQLPGSGRDADLLTLIKNEDRSLASGASEALLARSKDRKSVYEAILASPHAESLIRSRLYDRMLAQDEKLRESVVSMLAKGLIRKTSRDYLEQYLRNLPEDDRRTVLSSLLGAGLNAVPYTNTMALLKILGDLKDPAYLPIYANYLQDPKQQVRSEAIKSIGRTFSPKAAPLLLEALKDDVSGNAALAKAYLQRIDEYIQETLKWHNRFGTRKPTTPGPGVPTHPKK